MTNAERLAASTSTVLTALDTMRTEFEEQRKGLEGRVLAEFDAMLADLDRLQARMRALNEVATPKETTPPTATMEPVEENPEPPAHSDRSISGIRAASEQTNKE